MRIPKLKHNSFFTAQCQQTRDGLKDERQHRSSTTHCYFTLTDLAQRLVHRHRWELEVGDTRSLAQELCTWPSKQLQPTTLKGLQLNKQRICSMLRAFSSGGVTSVSAVKHVHRALNASWSEVSHGHGQNPSAPAESLLGLPLYTCAQATIRPTMVKKCCSGCFWRWPFKLKQEINK